ncbi:MAG: class I SAM-dependent methyltransferase [Chitinophagaceae bacterium]|nr:class I SAM-dependent methyltransferase [Chitinophagaceae bacterium]
MPINKNKISEFLKKQSFRPEPAGVLINPFYFIRKALYLKIKQTAPSLSGILLDFGCGRKPYEDLFTVEKYIGVDMEQTGHEHTLSKVDVYYDGKTIPFENEYFDSVFCSEVFEHIFNIEEILQEVSRVLKPGGKMLVTVPFCWNEHEIPYDFGRYTSFGIKHVLSKAGFEILEYHKTGNFSKVNFQLWALYFYSLINARDKKVNFIFRMLLIAPINILGVILLPLLPKNDSLYFNNIVLVRKPLK